MKLIIVEDEKMIRNGLVKHVPWKDLGISEFKTAANGYEALEICKVFAPDIVVSDIRMPGIDGVVLCRKLRECFPECEIIFVTGYDDKEYLMAAIDLQAVRYIEKPVNVGILSDAIRSAMERVIKTKMHKSADLHSLLLDETFSWADTSGSKNYCIGILKMQQAGKILDLQESLAEYLERKGVFLQQEVFDAVTLVMMLGDNREAISWDSIMKEAYAFMKEKSEEGNWFLTFGDIVDDLQKTGDSYKTALKVQGAVAFKGWNHMTYPEEQINLGCNVDLGKKRIDIFIAALADKQKDKAIACLEQLYAELQEKQVYMNGEIRYAYYSMAQSLVMAENCFHPENVEKTMRKLSMDFFEQAVTFQEMHQYLMERLEELFEAGDLQNSSYIAKQVMDYIVDHHVDCSLTIKTLADYVGLTPTYLSNLFKKNTGITIGQYMAAVRVEHAKQLMKDPHLKLYEISEQVGYTDANYFAKIFKRKTGITLSDYKKGIGMQ